MSTHLSPRRSVMVFVMLFAACSRSSFTSPSALIGQTPILIGAGDIAVCGSRHAEATARVLDSVPGIVFTVGDHAYPSGTTQQFTDCYAPTWGRHRARTRPAPGNHDYHSADAAPYFAYFGESAGPAGLGYYSYNLGDWHIVSLNSNIAAYAGSPQEQWLRSDLAAHGTVCTAAYWHHPMFSSGPHGSHPHMGDIWRVLQEFGADLAISGHDHTYERFAPQDAEGRADPIRGVRQFVVGTGGASPYEMWRAAPNSEIQGYGDFGVLKLTLHAEGYDWEFLPVAGATFHDSGSGQCVN